MSTINSPNSKGAACGFCKRCFRFPPVGGLKSFVSAPPNLPNYALGPQSCWPQAVAEPAAAPGLALYPNPAKEEITVRSAQGTAIESVLLLDITGRQLRQLRVGGMEARLDLSGLPAGPYFIVVQSSRGRQSLPFTKE